jgi:hypothetical protein
MMLTDRDCRLIAAVADFGILTRAQIASHLAFGSVTRVNAVLLRLVRHGYLTRRLQPTVFGTRRQTYIVGLRGLELLAGSRVLQSNARRGWREVSDLFVEHRLLVNDVRLAFEHASMEGYHLRTWKGEAELKALNLGLIPDGYADYDLDGKSYAVFIEADNGTETLGRWRQKVANYLDLAYSGRYQSALGRQYFRVLVTVPSLGRLQSVLSQVARQTDRLFWLTTVRTLAECGPFAAIWYRPKVPDLQSLISRS